MEKHSDLNSILIEGKVIEIHEKDFIIQTFRYDEENSIQCESRFQIVTSYGRKYPLSEGIKVRIVGKICCQNGDERTTIISDFIEINKK